MRLLTYKISMLVLVLLSSFLMVPPQSFAKTNPKIDPVFYHQYKNSSNEVTVIVTFREMCQVVYASKPQILDRLIDDSTYCQKLLEIQQDWIKGFSQKVPLTIRHYYQKTLNGCSMKIRGYNLRFLVNDQRVEHISNADVLFKKNRHIAVNTVSAKKAWNMVDSKNENITGKGVRIGIIDTGIDYNHPDFLDSDGKASKIKGGKDFADNDNDFLDNGSTFKPGFVPHGTHVAGIVAGNNLKDPDKKGMAPNCDLWIYKVFSSKDDSCRTDTIVAAIDRSAVDKCSAVNLSLGNPYPRDSVDTTDPFYTSISNATRAGVLVICAAGNEGARSSNFKLVISAPGTYEPSLCVAGSDDRMRVILPFVFPDQSTQKISAGKMSYTPSCQTIPSHTEIVDCGFGAENEFEEGKVKGKIALISRGPKSYALSYKEKNLNAKKAGAIGVITYNYDNGPLHGNLIEPKDDPYALGLLPNIELSGFNATLLKSYIAKGGVLELPKEGFVGLYDMSSAGPCMSGNDGIFKPEVSAPGKQICSAIMSSTKSKKKIENPYDDWDGTSMATPGVTGVAALVKQAHPAWSPGDIKAVLMNSADLLVDQFCNIPYSFLNQGSGQVNAVSAINTQLVTTPPSFMRSMDKIKQDNSFDIKNLSDKTVTANLSFEIFGETEESNPIEADFSENEVTVSQGTKKSFSVSFRITSKKMISKRYEGVIWIKTDSAKYHIPVLIFKGSILDVEKPLAYLSITSPEVDVSKPSPTFIKFQANAGSRFLVTGIDPEYEIRTNCYDSFKIEVFDTKKNSWGTIFYCENLFVGQYAIPWNGKDINGNEFLPNGNFYLKCEMGGTKYVIDEGKIKSIDELLETSEIKNFTIIESTVPSPPLLILACPGKVKVGEEFVLDILFADAKDAQEIDIRLAFSKSATTTISYTLDEFVDMNSFSEKRDVKFIEGEFTLKAKRDPAISKSRIHVATIRLRADGVSAKTGLIILFDLKRAQNSKGDLMRTFEDFPVITTQKTDFTYGDFNRDGKVNDADLDLLMEQNLKTYKDKGWNAKFDLNNDLMIDLSDFVVFSRYYEKE